MRNNDIMDEDYGKEIPTTEIDEPQPKVVPWPLAVFGLVVLACICTILVALTIRFDRWLLH